MLTLSPKIRAVKSGLPFAIVGTAQAWCLLIFAFGIGAGIAGHTGIHAPLTTAIPVLAAIAAYHALARRQGSPNERMWQRAGVVALVALVVATYVWALIYDSNQSSDFGLYYRCGVRVPDSLTVWIADCRSHFFYHADNTYWVRALVYSAPFGAIFGENYPAFKLYNATLHAATMAVLFFGLQALKGPRAATVALLLLGTYPEWLYSVTVATPDNLAILLVVSFLLLLPVLSRTRHGFIPVTCIAAIAVVANLARTVGPFLIITLCLWTLITMNRTQWKSALYRLVAIVALYNFGNWIFVQVIHGPANGQFNFLQRISTIDLSQPYQNYRLVFAWLDQFLPAVSPGDRGNVIVQKILLEFSEGFSQYPSYLYAKATGLFQGTGYYSFSSTDLGSNPDSVITAPAFSVPTSASMPTLLASLLLSHLVLASLSIIKVRRDSLFVACIFFMAVLLLVVLGFGDTQARYSLLIAPAIAITCAVALFPHDRVTADQGAIGQRNVAWTALGGVAILIVYCIGSMLAAQAALRIPKPLAMAKQEPGKQIVNGTTCKPGKPILESSYKRLKITIPPGSSCSSVSIPLPADTSSFSFFVSHDQFPFPFEPKTTSSYRYRVEQNGTALYDGDLGEDIVQWHKLNTITSHDDPTARENFITFSVTSNGGSAPDAFVIWLLAPSAKTINF
ncbi:hypothetical protein BLA14095_04974 [Burkholderia lata]|uniref:hypothetical protein n=1 Tax=Burkholderia lata (strain ATCC 17760 / DSM 23089 / LMG 22485 / NCIMB 9086 / R18194 / 383) TaxID=482957 RepID=UPI0014533931|nr:hypothetical protein [Burkholderia lata]VWC05505.1 hypothetical protein BLA14095_04974 [Burkholderia lata]